MKLALGTVQFGLDYGISNPAGRVRPEMVEAILAHAAQNGIEVLDTAFEYGESEKVLGESLEKLNLTPAFRIVTKTPHLRGPDPIRVKEAFQESLARLRVEHIDTVLFHRAEDLLGPQGEKNFQALEGLRPQVGRIGVSVYDASEIDAILARFPIQVVQLPLNLLDQRLLRSGHLKDLNKRGVEVHVRSAFLQGLLLMPPASLPPQFQAIRPLLTEYHSWLSAEGISPVEGALRFLRGISEIDRIVVGVCDLIQLKEIMDAFVLASVGVPSDFDRFACIDPAIVNPSLWKPAKSKV